jgi:hypothetical protein
VHPSYAPGEQFVLQIGDIHVTNLTVYTPSGSFPLRGSVWQAHDNWQAKQTIPQWAVICAIVGFFLVCALSLLFLLAKETAYTGFVQVTVTGAEGQVYATHVAVNTPTVHAIHEQVNYLRFLASQ